MEKRVGVRTFLQVFFFVALFFLESTAAQAATSLSSVTLPTGTTTWTKAGGPYLVTEVQVPVGGTLIIEPGTVVKLRGTYALYVFGTLHIGAAGSEPVVITSFADDTVEGDTNNDGSVTVPTGFDWCSIGVHTAASLTVTQANIRYGGCSVYGQLYNFGGDITVTDSKLFQSNQYAIVNSSGNLSVTNTEITGNVSGVRFHNGAITLQDNAIYGNTEFGVNNTSLAHTVIDATDTWWGSDVGPFHSTLNPAGLGNNQVSNYVTFSPWLHVNPLEDFPLCTENCYSNILFLPGLQASRLYAGGEKLWEPENTEEVERLFLDSDGKSKSDDIVTREVIDEKPNFGNIYKSLLVDFENWKMSEGIISDYTVAPYDWRLTLEEIMKSGKKTDDGISYLKPADSPFILSELRRLASTSKSGKVMVIAHSNGGLVAKAMTDTLGAEAGELIDRIVFVGVPQTGTPKALGSLLHGYDQGLPSDWFSPLLSPKTARTFANNMPSVYHLLPSENYFSGENSGVDTPVITFKAGEKTDDYINQYGQKIDSFSELYDFLLRGDGKVTADSSDLSTPSLINTNLLLYGRGIHDNLDSGWSVPVGIKVYQIAGFGEETPATIRYWTGKKCVQVVLLGQCLAYESTLQYTPEMVVDGDGTVLAPSALAMGAGGTDITKWWVDLAEYDSLSRLERNHGDIFEISQLRDFIKQNILIGTSDLLPEFLKDSEPTVGSGKRLKFYLHSPLALAARDQHGNEISTSVSTLPGARYQRLGEVQYISVPAESAPTLVLDGEAEGSFTLEVEEVNGNVVVSRTTFAAIPTRIETEVTMDFPDGTLENAHPLVIDYNGDNTPEFSLEPKVGETVTLPPIDTTPPEAKIFFDPETTQVKVEGIDDNGPVRVSTIVSDTKKKKTKDQKGTTVTVTLTDFAENTTLLVYWLRFPEHERRATLEFVSISYNGVVTNFSETLLRYQWLEKNNLYRLFASYIKTPGEKLEAHYRPKQDMTVIMTKPEDLDESDDDTRIDSRSMRKKLPGLVVPFLETKEGGINIKY